MLIYLKLGDKYRLIFSDENVRFALFLVLVGWVERRETQLK